MVKGILSLIAVASLYVLQALGQKVEIKMTAEPTSAGFNEPIKLIITVEERPDAVILSELPDFKVIAPIGPPMVYSEMRGVGVDVEEIVISTYTALVVGKVPGKYKVDGASVVNGKKMMQTNSLIIQIEDRKVSWEDSSAVAQKYTGFVGNNKSYTPPKTQVSYNKPTGGASAYNSSVTSSFGRGVDIIELIPEVTTINVKSGEEFTVIYTLYRETDKTNFTSNVEVVAPSQVEGLVILEGPNKRLHSQANGFRKLTQGTVEYVFYAESSGEFQIPPLQLIHNDLVVESQTVQILIQ